MFVHFKENKQTVVTIQTTKQYIFQKQLLNWCVLDRVENQGKLINAEVFITCSHQGPVS